LGSGEVFFWQSYGENQATENSSYDLPYMYNFKKKKANLRFVPGNAVLLKETVHNF
jgi:hypothetical protein